MPDGISYYLQNKFIDHVLRNTPITSGSKNWVALYTDNPTAADTGTEVAFSGSYARAYVREEGTVGYPFSVGTDGYTRNSYTITFNYPTATWGTITHWGLRDAPTGGNLYYYGALKSGSGLITAGNRLSIPPSHLTIFYNKIYLSNKLLNHVLNGISYTSPGSSVYGALYFTMPYNDGTGGTEVSGGGYSRQQITNWISPTSGSTYNISGSIVFCSSASVNWASAVTGMCLRDAPTGGNMLHTFVMTAEPTEGYPIIRKYDKFVVNENTIVLSFTN